MTSALDAFHELSYYTLTQPRDVYIHQHAVDAFAAQTATSSDKPIKRVFALIGLQLHAERGFSGRQVQDFHMKLAQFRKAWPTLAIPDNRGDMTVHDVLRCPGGPERDLAIHRWCDAVWHSWAIAHEVIRELAQRHGGHGLAQGDRR